MLKYLYQVPSKINGLINLIQLQRELFVKSSDIQSLVDSQNNICISISDIVETICLSPECQLEKKVVFLYLFHLLEGLVCKETTGFLESNDSHGTYNGYNLTDKTFESSTFNHGFSRNDTSLEFLYPKPVSLTWFDEITNNTKTYTRQKTCSNLILVAMIADSIQQSSRAVIFDRNKYCKRIKKLEHGGYSALLISLGSYIPLVSNMLIPIGVQIDNSFSHERRFNHDKFLNAVVYYDSFILSGFQKTIYDLFEKLSKYADNDNNDIFGNEHLFDMLSKYFPLALELNKIELNLFFQTIYPPYLVFASDGKKAPQMVTTNWNHLFNQKLKYCLND